jgi:hypothetical protein
MYPLEQKIQAITEQCQVSNISMEGKIMHPLEQEIQAITEQCQVGNISTEERDYLLTEIRDIRAAQECAGNEQLFRIVVQACNIASGLA